MGTGRPAHNGANNGIKQADFLHGGTSCLALYVAGFAYNMLRSSSHAAMIAIIANKNPRSIKKMNRG
jgi:hypothetical protein